MSNADGGGRRLQSALAKCPPLAERGAARDELWITVQDVVCTKGSLAVAPHGSSNPIEVTPAYATDELLAAMEWLMSNEPTARRLSPTALYVALRGHATRGAHGSARAAQADLLRGVTNVPPGSPVVWAEFEDGEAA